MVTRFAGAFFGIAVGFGIGLGPSVVGFHETLSGSLKAKPNAESLASGGDQVGLDGAELHRTAVSSSGSLNQHPLAVNISNSGVGGTAYKQHLTVRETDNTEFSYGNGKPASFKPSSGTWYIKPSLAVEDVHVENTGVESAFGSGDATIIYTIHNTGNVRLSASQTVSVSDTFGLRSEASGIPESPELPAGHRVRVKVPVHGVAPAIRLSATVTLTPLLTEASGITTALDPVQVTARVWTSLTWMGILFVLTALLIMAVILRRATRTKNRASR
ncbi:hypothetical protein [Streptomyces sp. NPDC002547]